MRNLDTVSRIRQLDAGVVNKIAAGEVIERPASVVKELLENSVDASATRIEVDVVEGGTELIRVVDDGHGIHPDDLMLAVTSHATSKITTDEDLFEVRTMGFRGEALASMAAVSRFRIRSRRHDRTEGFELEVNAGEIGTLQPCGCPAGTQIEIRQIFCNTPVRRKFLKTKGTEFGHISEQFTRMALAHPRLTLVLRHNQKTVFELPPSENLLDRLRLFFGQELADDLIPVESTADRIRLWGYVGHPRVSKSTRKGQHLYLNGRWIQDRSLLHALNEAYRGLLMVGRQPLAFLFLEMPPHLADVNVHPTKAEVRFRDGQALYRQLLSTLRNRFLSMELDSEYQVSSRASAASEGALHPVVDPQKQSALQQELSAWAVNQLDQQVEAERALPAFFPGSERGQEPSATVPTQEGGGEESPSSPLPHKESADGSASFQEDSLSSHRAMQVHDCYLVLESQDGLTVIDQHALHERVIYESLRRRVLAGSVESQKLLVPVSVELSAREAIMLVEHAKLLSQLGFDIEEFGKSTILVTAHPVLLGKADLKQLVHDLADHLDGGGQKPTRRDILDELLHMMSCKAAIKAGQRLAPEEIDSLLRQRHLIDDAHHCPHGRPTALVLSRAELDRQFGRLG